MSRNSFQYVRAVGLVGVVLCASAHAQEASGRAHVAIVGDADRFNIGQDSYCGKRTEIDNPSSVSFQIPGGTPTWFHIRSKFRTQIGEYTCEGEFSFTPQSGHLHVIRYTFDLADHRCKLEMFRSVPGESPEPASFTREPGRACILQ